MKFSDEVRHLDGIKANFSVSESEYLASSTLLQEIYSPEPFQPIIYTSVPISKEHKNMYSGIFWSKYFS